MGKLMYRALGTAFAVPATITVKKALNTVWRKSKPGNPPRDPKAPDAHLSDVLTWAGVSGLSMAAGQYMASRVAAATHRALTGKRPPGWGPAQQAKTRR
jgi:Protein of unknown function (DUF4235)